MEQEEGFATLGMSADRRSAWIEFADGSRSTTFETILAGMSVIREAKIEGKVKKNEVSELVADLGNVDLVLDAAHPLEMLEELEPGAGFAYLEFEEGLKVPGAVMMLFAASFGPSLSRFESLGPSDFVPRPGFQN